MPEAKDALPILILAEPLIQAGLERLLEDSFQLKTSTGADTGRVDLVIWSVSVRDARGNFGARTAPTA